MLPKIEVKAARVHEEPHHHSIHSHLGVFSYALASVPSLTGRSTGHQRAAHVAAS
jgi:hypothetical protein